MLTKVLQADLRSRGLVSERKCNTVDVMVTTMVNFVNVRRRRREEYRSAEISTLVFVATFVLRENLGG